MDCTRSGIKKDVIAWLRGSVHMWPAPSLLFPAGPESGGGAGHPLVAVRGRSCQGCAQGEEEQMGTDRHTAKRPDN